MASTLAPTLGAARARLGIRAVLNPDDSVSVTRVGGDQLREEVEARALGAACHTYLPPLRNAESDLMPGRGSRLARLLAVLTPDEAERTHLQDIARDANEELRKHPQVERAVDLVQGVLDRMTRGGHKQHTDIAFADPSFGALVRRLLSRLGEREARDLFESGLGYQNLLYMAVLLAHLTEIERVPLRVLLVEEPEAHLHPQLQDLLLRYLQDSAGERAKTQVIVTSNSPQFAAAAELERLVVLSRPGRQTQALARRVADVDMTDLQRAHVRRFLDVTKASLFFARGVILVEGVSEQLLLPPFADLLGGDLADAGVSVINIGGVAFEPFVRLFGEDGLPIRCAVVSDGDADPEDPALEPSDRVRKLHALQSTRVRTFVSTVTLEWDLARANPGHGILIEELDRLHPVNVAGLPDAADGAEAWATGFRNALTRKAELAQNLAERIGPGVVLDVPDYLQQAVAWVTTPPEEREEEQPANERSGEVAGNA